MADRAHEVAHVVQERGGFQQLSATPEAARAAAAAR